MKKLTILLILALTYIATSIYGNETDDKFYQMIGINTPQTFLQEIAEKIPDGNIVTIEGFRGNFANEFTKALTAFLHTLPSIQITDYDTQKKALDANLKYAEPVYDGKYTDAMPNLTSPTIEIHGAANKQKNNFLLKQKIHLDYEIKIVQIDTGIDILYLHDRIVLKANPPIILFIILIILTLAIARWIIFLKKGYNVMHILIAAMLILTIIVVWYLL